MNTGLFLSLCFYALVVCSVLVSIYAIVLNIGVMCGKIDLNRNDRTYDYWIRYSGSAFLFWFMTGIASKALKINAGSWFHVLFFCMVALTIIPFVINIIRDGRREGA